MVAGIAAVIAYLAAAGAAASWIAGAVLYARVLSESNRRGAAWLLVPVWPFATGQLRQTGTDGTGLVNKALVALLACVMVAVAAFAVSANLQRISK